jgi:N-acetyl-anhydromuramyl-L-alanine amidase AmpD
MVEINNDFLLNENNYISVNCVKTNIILASTFNNNMRHVIGWKNRLNGKNKKTAAFTIDAAGTIYKHFDPKNYSNFLKNVNLNTKSIVILLENDGWLVKDNNKNEFINWLGDIYKEPDLVFNKKWRGYEYWVPYTKEQFEATIDLVKILCNEFDIPLQAISHNTKVDNINDFNGVIYRSNIEKHYTDLNPSWDFNEFKNRIENETKH